MIINGEKYACDACVRGHRVSNCQHSERELQHINKKGRPVSQCQHCRGLRRSKSSHVKCDCGDKSSKCVHQKGVHENHRAGCCCKHGGQCTCSHKKDISPLGTVLEVDVDRAAGVNSSSKITKTHSRQRSRAHTHHSTTSITSFDGFDLQAKPTTGLTTYHYPQTTTKTDLRRTQSATASSTMNGMSPIAHDHGVTPLDLTGTSFQSMSPNSFDMFSSPVDLDQSIWSAGLQATPSMDSIDWNMYDGLNGGSRGVNSLLASTSSQTQSHRNFEQTPTLATSPSGHASEDADSLTHHTDDLSRTVTNNTGFSFDQHGIKHSNNALHIGGDEHNFASLPSATMAPYTGFHTTEEEQPFWMGQFDEVASTLGQANGHMEPNHVSYWDIGS